MKKNTAAVFMLFIVLTALNAFAEKLVYIPVKTMAEGEKLISVYRQPIYLDGNFLLSVETDAFTPENRGGQVVDRWQPQSYYFVLYPIPGREYPDISNYGAILHRDKSHLLFRTRYEALNDFSEFHNYKIVRVFNRKLEKGFTQYRALIPEEMRSDSLIQQIVNQVKADSIWHYITLLQNMERYTKNAQGMNASNFMMNFYQKLGYDTVYFHDYHSGWMPNVVAVKYGKQFPNEIYLLGGHYDVYTNGAPGADDNGSGTAAIMEIARVLSQLNYKRTIKIVNFSGEELGLLGSAAYASQAAAQGENLLGMINMDMIAYVAPGDSIDVDIVKNNNSMDLYYSFLQASQTYVPTLSIVNGALPFGASSDHASFWNNGFPAIFPFEDSDQYSPYIHTSNDKINVSANNQTLARLGSQSVTATLLSLAGLAQARISGHIVSAETLEPVPQALVIYNGDSVLTDANGNFTTPPLMPGNYYLEIDAAGFDPDTLNRQVNEFEFVTLERHLIPQGQLRPFVHLKRLLVDDDSSGASAGNNNGIPDAGETLEVRAELFNTGNQSAQNIALSAQINSPWAALQHNSINVAQLAVSDTSATQEALVISLDPQTPKNTVIPVNLTIEYMGYVRHTQAELKIQNRGMILLVQDDDPGAVSSYTAIFDTLGYSYDLVTPGEITDQLPLYPAIVWYCGEDWSTTLSATDQQKLSTYLDGGGKLFISGADIGYDINNSSFYGNYLKASYQGDGPVTTITQASGVAGDPVSGSFAGGLTINDNYIDQINPLGGAQTIFRYSYSGNTYNCGVRYQGSYQLVYLTFAFENIPGAPDRQLLMENILNWFNLVSGIDPLSQTIPGTFNLNQNFPNPFNSQTTIRFSLANPGRTLLQVFDILGRKVRTLVSDDLLAGAHQIHWDGKNDLGLPVASGLYIYRLNNGSQVRSRKLLMLK
ncbi:MAG: M28 family peptidase [Calditrichia bacterium]